MKRYILLFLLFLSFSVYAQNTINNYKYVVVPEKFSFLKQNDQYGLNSLTKALLAEKGFTVYLDNNELPSEIANNKCQALNAEVLEKSSMFTTSLTLLLKDCQGNIVFKTKEGKSREKEYRVSYNLALRDAFTSLDAVQYAYNGKNNEQQVQPTVAATTTITTANTPAKTAIAPPQATASMVSAKTVQMQPNQPAGTLYAQVIANGYQLIDTTPKIVLTLLKTSVQDYFIANNGTSNGIVLKKNNEWFFEYYQDGKLTSEKLMVKF
ncbi:hypothetical protein SAMN05421821_11574 [Mucilaginibacter lappiensis]|uniref:Beta-lactamase-inhibitor-like, PepSY-like n=1 Tax=Mucilaginibacter lappiensis TaxID=354630 RepID=A0ABR6PQH0_9SPHI|nr:hypothetical protein [Mucilaginibacter lappiensis]MBB6111969.1 hypothetical protein [Mucilaginibacter lappiensis]SIR91167.1 hypothetical protein SAMN05421821_11574 [Mucilaginibacter lappiensis]